MATKPRVTSLPLELREKLNDLAQKVRIPAVTARLVRNLLPDQAIAAENGRLDLVTIWARRQGITPEQACVDLAWHGNLITAADCESLRGRLGKPVQMPPAGTVPG